MTLPGVPALIDCCVYSIRLDPDRIDTTHLRIALTQALNLDTPGLCQYIVSHALLYICVCAHDVCGDNILPDFKPIVKSSETETPSLLPFTSLHVCVGGNMMFLVACDESS